MFSGLYRPRQDRRIEMHRMRFKQPDFYQRSPQDREELLRELAPDRIEPCHRQNSVSFGDHRVISLRLDRTDFLARRNQVVHHNRFITRHPLVERLRGHVSDDQLVLFEYHQWAKDNILPGDIILNFSTVLNHSAMLAFCQEHGLGFNDQMRTDIENDIKHYS